MWARVLLDATSFCNSILECPSLLFIPGSPSRSRLTSLPHPNFLSLPNDSRTHKIVVTSSQSPIHWIDASRSLNWSVPRCTPAVSQNHDAPPSLPGVGVFHPGMSQLIHVEPTQQAQFSHHIHPHNPLSIFVQHSAPALPAVGSVKFIDFVTAVLRAQLQVEATSNQTSRLPLLSPRALSTRSAHHVFVAGNIAVRCRCVNANKHGLGFCGRLVLGQGAKVLSRSRTGGFFHHILEDEAVGQKEEQGDQRDGDEEGEVNGDVEAIRETHNAHEP